MPTHLPSSTASQFQPAPALHAAVTAPSAGTVDEDVESVVEHLLKLGQKYEFKVDEDCVRDSVEETADLLRITLDEAQTVKACDLALERQGSVG